MDFSKLPKIELHLHLDCSLSYNVVQQLDSDITELQYRDNFIAPPKCRDLADYISRSESAVALMQTREALQMVTEDLFEQLQTDNVIYAEIRFAPLLHTREGLTVEEVVDTVSSAVEEQAEATGIEAGIILCTLRNYSEDESMKTVKLAEAFADSGVVGFDIAADEAGYPIDNHISAFEYAVLRGINRTAHAGEACGAKSVWETLQYFKPSRIGHGVRSIEDPKLVDYLVENNIHLEVCPTSNVQTNVFGTIADHSLDKLYGSGVSLSINTDTRTISNITLDEEYPMLANIFDWDMAKFKKCNLEAVNHAFADEDTKKRLRTCIHKAYEVN